MPKVNDKINRSERSQIFFRKSHFSVNFYKSALLCTLALTCCFIFNLNGKSEDDNSVVKPFSNDQHTVLLMHFDERQGLPRDSSTFGNNAIKNTAEWIRNGKFGSCLYFNGKNSYVEIPNSASLNIKDGEITIEAWVKPEPGKGEYPAIVSKYGAGGGYLLTPVGSLNYKTFFFLRRDSQRYMSLAADQPLPLGEWSHIAAVRDKDGRMKMFINGIEQSIRKDFVSAFASDGIPLRIGKYGNCFTGAIDEVRISNIARYTEQQIISNAKSIPITSNINLLRNAGFITTTNPDVPDNWFCSNSPFVYPDWPECWKLVSEHFIYGTRSIRLLGRTKRNLGAIYWHKFKKNNYTFSVYLKADRPELPVTIHLGKASKVINATETWQRYSITKELKDLSSRRDGVFQDFPQKVGITLNCNGVVWINAPQLEEGNFSTPFVFSSQDLIRKSKLDLSRKTLLPIPKIKCRVIQNSPIIDGKLTDGFYKQAARIGNFVLFDRDNPALEQTLAFIGRDKDALYIALACKDSRQNGILGESIAHDSEDIFADDNVEIFLSPFFDGKDYYHFAMNAAGSKYEAHKYDKKWDANWDGAVSRDGNGWNAEFRIPFSSLGLNTKCSDEWRINLCRHRANKSNVEYSSWSRVHKNFHNPERFGILSMNIKPLEKFFLTTKGINVDSNTAEIKITSERADSISTDVIIRFFKGEAEIAADSKSEVILPGDSKYISFKFHNTPSLLDSSKVEIILKDINANKIVFRKTEPTPIFFSTSGYSRTSMNIFLDRSFYTDEPMANLLIKYGENNGPSSGDRVNLKLLRADGSPVKLNKTSWELSHSKSIVPIDIHQLGPGVYKLIVELNLKETEDKILKKEKQIPLVKAPETITALKVNREKQVFLLNGKPLIPLVAIPEYLTVTKEMFTDMKLHGFNTVLQSVGRSDNDDNTQELLDSAQSNGFKVILWLVSGRSGETYESLKSGNLKVIGRFKDHPALIGWYLLDEPEGWWEGGYQMEGQKIGEESDILDLYQAVKKIDPYHPAFVNHCGKWHRGRGQYGGKDASDIYSADHYTIGIGEFTEGQASMQSVADYVADMNYDGIRDGKPVSITLEFANPLFDVAPYFPRCVTPAEIKCMTYLSLIHGARQVAYYDRKPMSEYLWGSMTSLNHEVKELTPILVSTDKSVLVSVNEQFVHFTVKEKNGKYYLIAVNSSETPVTAAFALFQREFNERGTAKILFENRKLKWSNYTLIDWFAPYERHIYCLPALSKTTKP